jgi:PPOX class probable F420-dependent enzyme
MICKFFDLFTAARRSAIMRGQGVERANGRCSVSVTIPERFLDLLTENKPLANLATLMSDGSPQVTPVWFDFSDGRVRVNTARGRVKDRNMSRDGRVALVIVDPENPYRHIQIRGRVARSTEEGADAHIDSLAKKYLGKDKYPYRRPGEIRVIYEIEPTSTSTM